MIRTVYRIWFALFSGCILLILSGIAYRLFALQLDALAKEPMAPAVPFSSFPYSIGSWSGYEVPLSEVVLEVSGNEDHLNRRYLNRENPAEVNLYLAYTSQPRTMLGHRPLVCYVNSGWQHEGTEEITIMTADGGQLTTLLHKFRLPLAVSGINVINYYYVNGSLTTDHNEFFRLKFRSIQNSKQHPRYVIQVQVSSFSEKAAIDFAREIAPLVLVHLPEAKAAAGL